MQKLKTKTKRIRFSYFTFENENLFRFSFFVRKFEKEKGIPFFVRKFEKEKGKDCPLQITTRSILSEGAGILIIISLSSMVFFGN